MRRWEFEFIIIFSLSLLIHVDIFAAAEMTGNELIEKGIFEYQSENYEEALELLSKAREEFPNSSVAAFYLGLTYKQLEDYEKAAGEFKSAILLSPSVQDAYVELVEVLNQQEELEEAKKWILKAEEEGVKPGHVAFLKGLVLVKEGNYEEAIASFTKARDLDQSLAQPAELQIALIQIRAKKFTEATERLKTVITINPTSDLASFAKEYEIALAQRRERHKAWLFTLGAGYQYDDNLVLKPNEDIPGVRITGKEDSSAAGQLKIEYRPFLEGGWSLSGMYSLYSNVHCRIHSYDLMAQSISLIPGYDFETHAVSVPMSYDHFWLDEHQYMSLLSVDPTISVLFGPGGSIGTLSLTYSVRDMLEAPLIPEEDRDGNIYSLSVGYFLPFLRDGGFLNFKYEFVREETEGKNWENTGHKIGAGMLVPLWKKVSLISSGEAFFQDYRNEHTAFGKFRKDSTYSFSAAIIWGMFYPGLNLTLQYSYTRADSNIAIYDYDRNVYTAGLEYRF